MEWFSDFYSTNISSALNMCQATHLALFQRGLIQVSHFVDERSESERVKRLVEGYIASKRQSWNLEWSLPIPRPGILWYFGLQNWNNFHVLACDFYCLFIHPVAHNTVWGHKWAITTCWLDMAIYSSTFWEARDHCQIRLLWCLRSIMCWQEHSWLTMSEFFKSYFNSVFDHYIRSVVPMFSKKSKWIVHFRWQLTALMNSV